VLFVAGTLDAINSWYEPAISELNRAAEIDPTYGDAYRHVARVYDLNGQPDKALIAHRQAVALAAGYYRPYLALGQFFIHIDQYSDAVAPLQQAVALAPDEPDARYPLGLAYLNLGKFKEAEVELRNALGLRETVNNLDTLGTTLMYEHEERDAIPYFLRALQIDSNHYQSWTQLGICYRRLGLSQQSEQANRSGLRAAEVERQRNPKRGYTRAFVAYLNARLGNRQMAESEIAQALTFSTDGAEVRGMAVATYEALDERAAALSVLGAASSQLLADLNRWPDLAGLQGDPRFIQMLVSNRTQ
jgi:tetratricopeptide (TPR) repeat protein